MGGMVSSRKGLVPYRPPENQPPASERPLPLFAFGRVLDERFVADLLERPVPAEPCLLPGHGVVELGGGSRWQVLRPEEDGVVAGRLYRGLDGADFERLDAYQGVGEGLYRRHVVAVQPGEGMAHSTEPAFAYLPTDRTLRRYGTG